MSKDESADSQIKGTMAIDFVRIVRANRDKNWEKWLTPADLEIVNGKVLPSNWYPYDFFRRIAFAVFKEIAGGNLLTAQQFGRFQMRGLLAIYKNVLRPGDPGASVKTLAALYRTFIRGAYETRTTELEERSLTFEIEAAVEDDEERLLPFVYQVSGYILEIAEQAGGKNPEVEIKGQGHQHQIHLRWQ